MKFRDNIKEDTNLVIEMRRLLRPQVQWFRIKEKRQLVQSPQNSSPRYQFMSSSTWITIKGSIPKELNNAWTRWYSFMM